MVAGLSVILLIAKTTAYLITGSVAILTDALESIVNVAAGLFGLYSLYVSARPKDQNHPYGHGKIEFLSAAVEGSMITLAGIIIIYEAIRNLIVHRAGVVDHKFLERMKNVPEAFTGIESVREGMTLGLSSETTFHICTETTSFCEHLILSVDEWFHTNPAVAE